MIGSGARRRSKRWTASGGAATTALVLAAAASGQTTNVERPRTIMVGRPSGGARADRIDAARTGRTRTLLPAAGLRTEWRVPLGALVERAPLTDARGCTYVVGTLGEVMAIARDGTERWRVATDSTQPGAAALLSDDTVVFVDGAGEAVAVRNGAVRWRVAFGRSATVHPAPLPLDDGGVIVATTHELAALDADGRERSRAILPEATELPLLAALGRVVAITVSGAVWSWVPGALEPLRIASFGSPVDGGAALADDHTLVAVTADRMHLTAVDVLGGSATTCAVAQGGMWLGPPAMRGRTAHVVLLTPTGELGVAVDASGSEITRVSLALHPSPAGSDAGAAGAPLFGHTPPLVDPSGAFAFGTAEGAIGVASENGVDLLSEACEPSLRTADRAAPPVTGLAPLEAGAFVAVCRTGALVAISGRKGGT
jgi:hypothetical protein